VSKSKTVAFTFFLIAPFSWVSLAAQKPGNQPKSNVILVTIDTLRADHLGCYGNKAITTPHIDKLASEGARFTTVVAQVPQTLPSHCSILTGTYPMFHKVRDNIGYRLDDSKTTLPEILKAHGYRTGAFVGSYVLDSRFGLGQGFDTYYDHFNPEKNKDGFLKLEQLERRGEEVMHQAIQWIDGTSPDTPFFAWIHLYDPHDPYDPPHPFKAQYKSRLYDGEIAYVDEQTGRLVSFLNTKHLYDKTLIVFTSDHGESFGEHREFKHGYFVYDTTLLVPLLFKPARQAFRNLVLTEQVRLVDIAPTILQFLDLPKISDIQGIGLLGLLLGRQKHLQLEAYSETFYPTQFGASSLRSLRQPNAKFIEAPKPELYKVDQDPGELINIHTQNQALANQLKNRLAELTNTLSDKGPEKGSQLPMRSEELEKLGALGYIGGPARAATTGSGSISLADPKDRVEIFQLLSEAGRNAATGRCPQAERQFTEAIQKAPGVSTAYFLLGRCYFNEQRFDQAYNSFQELLNLNPQSAEAQFYVAACEFYLNKLKSAETGFRRVLSINANYVYAHKYLGLIYQSRGQNQQALESLQKVVEISPGDEEAQFRVGLLLARQSRFAEAILHFKRALDVNPGNAATHRNLGIAYLRTNQDELAHKELAQACKLDPKFCTQDQR
jgi:arylsulfatase A-like enzyme/Flp pilus assembly protein TadD